MHPVGAGLCSAHTGAPNIPRRAAGTLRPKQDRGKPAHSVLSAYRGFRPSVKNARRRLKNPAFPGVFASYPLALKMFSPFDTFHASFFFIMM